MNASPSLGQKVWSKCCKQEENNMLYGRFPSDYRGNLKEIDKYFVDKYLCLVKMVKFITVAFGAFGTVPKSLRIC